MIGGPGERRPGRRVAAWCAGYGLDMADFSKRTKKARKQAAKRARRRAKATRKVVEKTSARARAQAAAGLFVAAGAAALLAKLVKGTGEQEQRYSSEPDNLPNTPDRPAATTPPPGAGTRETGSDTGSQTETERTRIEQSS